MISNVLLSLSIDDLYYPFHTLWNLALAADKYVLVNDNEVCGFGVVRYLPLDVVMLSETGKMIYSKIMEFDARMMSIDSTSGEIISCKV